MCNEQFLIFLSHPKSVIFFCEDCSSPKKTVTTIKTKQLPLKVHISSDGRASNIFLFGGGGLSEKKILFYSLFHLRHSFYTVLSE